MSGMNGGARAALALLVTVGLSGCAAVQDIGGRLGIGAKGSGASAEGPLDPMTDQPADAPPADLAPETAAPPPPPAAKTAEALDTTTAEQRAAATAAPAAAGRSLGRTVVSLGSPTEPGLWLKTPLVKAEAQGRVTNPASGKSSLVTLLPLDASATAGSQMSLAAMRLIGLSLTDLTEVEVALEG